MTDPEPMVVTIQPMKTVAETAEIPDLLRGEALHLSSKDETFKMVCRADAVKEMLENFSEST